MQKSILLIFCENSNKYKNNVIIIALHVPLEKLKNRQVLIIMRQVNRNGLSLTLSLDKNNDKVIKKGIVKKAPKSVAAKLIIKGNPKITSALGISKIILLENKTFNIPSIAISKEATNSRYINF
jgi:hypothetical protein